MEPLPTFWSPAEHQLLVGTTLAPAMSAKHKSLRREFDLLCSSVQHTRWFQLVQDHLDFDDWLQVDAMYRSRALDYPNIGHCMVPCVDIANHSAGEDTVAIYEKDADGNAVLLLRYGKKVKVCIPSDSQTGGSIVRTQFQTFDMSRDVGTLALKLESFSMALGHLLGV